MHCLLLKFYQFLLFWLFICLSCLLFDKVSFLPLRFRRFYRLIRWWASVDRLIFFLQKVIKWKELIVHNRYRLNWFKLTTNTKRLKRFTPVLWHIICLFNKRWPNFWCIGLSSFNDRLVLEFYARLRSDFSPWKQVIIIHLVLFERNYLTTKIIISTQQLIFRIFFECLFIKLPIDVFRVLFFYGCLEFCCMRRRLLFFIQKNVCWKFFFVTSLSSTCKEVSSLHLNLQFFLFKVICCYSLIWTLLLRFRSL